MFPLIAPALGAAVAANFSRRGAPRAHAAPRTVYLDHNATTPLDPRVREAMRAYLARPEPPGNPSSVHRCGKVAREVLELARQQVASAVGVKECVTFTSGGSEADTLAVVGLCTALRRAGRPAGLLTSLLEHPAVTASADHLEADGHSVNYVSVDGAGRITPAKVVEALHRDPSIGLVSLATANHELGNVYDIPSIATAVRSVRPDVIVHTDAVQAFGKIPINFRKWRVDCMSISAHKVGGPAGVGALIHRRDLELAPVICGGGQEEGRRPGTENLLGIHGFGLAALLVRDECRVRHAHVVPLRKRLREGLHQRFGSQALFIGDPQANVGNTLCVIFPGCSGKAITEGLDAAGIYVSRGSACTEGRAKPSQMALTLGFNEDDARCVIRFSLGRSNTAADIDKVLSVLPRIVQNAWNTRAS